MPEPPYGTAEEAGEDQAPKAQRLAQKINRLIDIQHQPGAKPLTNAEIAEGATALGYPISETFIYYLRKGQRDNPTMKILEGLAQFFAVPAAYFFDDAAAVRIEAELDMLAAMRDNDVRSIALRARSLSPDARRWLAETIERFPGTGAGVQAAGSEQGEGPDDEPRSGQDPAGPAT